MIRKAIPLLLLASACISCTNLKSHYRELYTSVESDALPRADERGNIIPDFSRVGYMWGDKSIPTLPIVMTLEPLQKGEDATKLLQDAIDKISELPLADRGAILLKKGEYIVSSPLTIDQSNIVLRGEGNDVGPNNSSVIYFTAKEQSSLLTIGANRGTVTFAEATSTNIKDQYTPVGRFFVRATNASDFSVNDEVVVSFNPNEQWIHDLKMDQIEPRKDGKKMYQWQSKEYKLNGERVITKISADTLWFDNPIVMPLDNKYGYTYVAKTARNEMGRINHVGVENLYVRSFYRNDEDEAHGWAAIKIEAAEHSWVREVKGQNFGYSLVSMTDKSKFITVADCSHIEPKSKITGGRRYTYLNSGQLNLVINCHSEGARHSYNASPRNVGPNVYVNCTGENNHSDDGPHHRWNQGTLYDNIISDGRFVIQDRGNYGSGHGWAGVGNILWNCKYDKITLQNPWISGKNYSIGSIGKKTEGRHKDRPDGEWISHGVNVSPQSLYEAQLAKRKELQPEGVFDVN